MKSRRKASKRKKVETILAKLRAGRPVEEFKPDLPQGVRFFVLGLAPNAARLSVRFYIEDDFGEIAERYLRHLDRLRIDPPPREDAPSIWRMLIETAVLRKSENIQPNLAGEWMRAILTDTPYPLTLLSMLIMRLRADHDVNALRVAILKSILIKNFNMEVPVSLDPDCKETGYLLGRLFAVYEQIQTAALGRNVNATIKDKFYGAASAQPRKVFRMLEAGSANHLSKIGKHFVNRCCFGEDLAAWLRIKLADNGVEVGPPGQEDWGWYLQATYGGDSIYSGSASQPAPVTINSSSGATYTNPLKLNASATISALA